MATVIQLEWSATVKLNNWAQQKSCTAATPFGDYEIKWAEHANIFIHEVSFNGRTMATSSSLPSAKRIAQDHFAATVEKCLAPDEIVIETKWSSTLLVNEGEERLVKAPETPEQEFTPSLKPKIVVCDTPIPEGKPIPRAIPGRFAIAAIGAGKQSGYICMNCGKAHLGEMELPQDVSCSRCEQKFTVHRMTLVDQDHCAQQFQKAKKASVPKYWPVGWYLLGHQEWNRNAVWSCHSCHRNNALLTSNAMANCAGCGMLHWVERMTEDQRQKALSNYQAWELENAHLKTL